MENYKKDISEEIIQQKILNTESLLENVAIVYK